MSNKDILFYLFIGILFGVLLSVCAWGIWDDITHTTLELETTHADLQRCIESDAAMWSEQWCEDCYSIWYQISERR